MTSVLSKIGVVFQKPFSTRSKIYPDTRPKTRMDVDHIDICDEEGIKEFSKRYGIDLGEGIEESFIPYIIDNVTKDMYSLIEYMNIGNINENIRDMNKENLQNIQNIYKINYILKEVDNKITNSYDIDEIDILSGFINKFTKQLTDKLRQTIIQKTKDMDLSDKKEYIIRIKQNLQNICAVNIENLLTNIKIGGSHKKSAKKSTKKGSKKRSAKKSTKKASKKRSVKKSAKKASKKRSAKKSVKKASKKRSAKKSVKKASKKRSVKKSAKKRSAKKSVKKSAKKASKKRSAKKSVKKASKKRSVKKLIAIKSQQKKRSAKKSMAKKW